MSDQLREALSAVVDGEADEFELRRVLDEVGRDDELASQWQRYEMIGAVLRSQALAPASLGIALAAALDDDADQPQALTVDTADTGAPGLQLATGAQDRAGAAASPQSGDKRGRFGPLVGLGVAATVAFAVVVAVETSNLPDGPQPQVAGQLTMASDGAPIAASDSGEFDTAEIDSQRARAYLVHHVQQTAMSRGRVVSFARLASLEDDSTTGAPVSEASSED
mgnify:CR=1 FL=1